MFMKQIAAIVLYLAVVLFCTEAYAQNYDLERTNSRYWPGNLAGRSADMLYNRLYLTDDQYSKIYSSFYNYYSNQSPDILGIGPYTNWSNQRTTISGFLTPEQVTTFSTFDDNSITNPVIRRQTYNSGTRTNNNSRTNTKIGNDNVKTPTTTDPTKTDK